MSSFRQKYKRNSTARARQLIGEMLPGTRRGLRSPVILAGSGIAASVACMDAANYATNILFRGWLCSVLLWVELLANLVAMLYQRLSARLDFVAGYIWLR